MAKFQLLLVLICFGMFHSTNVKAQTVYELDGEVVDADKKGIDLAMVSLQRFADSTFVKSAYTDRDGSFHITKVEPGRYYIQINLLGYTQYRDSIRIDESSNEISLPTIELAVSVKELDAVNIVATTPYIERKIDRTVINVDALISNAGSDILEVMERAPGITTDNNGTILLKGRAGVAIFINDKPSYLSGAELESYLRSLPAGSVQQIEIMTNPPAKYDSAGSAGVINIILKKDRLQGFNGNVSLSYRQGMYASSNNSLNLNYTRKKLNLYTNAYGGFWNSFQDLNINRYYINELGEPTGSFAQASNGLNDGDYLGATFGTDYYLTENASMGVSYKISNNPSGDNQRSNAYFYNPELTPTKQVVAVNSTEATFKNTMYNVFFRNKNDSTGNSFSVEADYVTYKSGVDQLFNNYLYDASGNLTYADQIHGNLPSTIDIYAAKTDYTRQFSDRTRFEAGLKSAFTKTDNEADYSTTFEGETTPDLGLSNRFLYDEWINAGYLNFSQSFGRVDVQAGLRVESTHLSGNQLGNSENPPYAFTRDYTDLFPTFYTSWKTDSIGNNVLNFSYGRRINRPYFQDLNPFINPVDKYTFYSGNPDLLPTYSHNLSLAYSYKSHFTISLNYSKTIDAITETLEIRDGIYYSRPGNIANSQSLGISFEGSLPINEWYTLNSYVELTNLQFVSPLYSEELNNNGTYIYLSATNSFKFGKGWGIDLTGNFQSDAVYAQLEIKNSGQVDIGFQKQILDKSGTIKLSVSDIFYTRRNDGLINSLRLTNADWNSKYDSRRVQLTFAWRFGKSSLSRQKFNSNGSGAEQQRVKG